MLWRIPAASLSGGGARKDTAGARSFEADPEALPAAQSAMKRSWKKKDSATSKKRENATWNNKANPLYCPKCKKEVCINVAKLRMVVSDEPDI